MERTTSAIAGGMLALLPVILATGQGGRPDQAPIGFISKDRVVEMARAADASVASFVPSPAALDSFVALVDPVHLRMFLCPARPADLALAALVGLAVEATANPALTVEFVAVTEDLAEPQALVSENGVTRAPEIIVYWMSAEVGRLRPEPGTPVETALADFIFQTRLQIAEEMILDREFFKYTFHKDLLALDCKRCHGPRGAKEGRAFRLY